MSLSCKRCSFRRAFSLMELLLVIFIISLVYFLGFDGIDKRAKPQAKITPISLKKEITHHPLFQGEGTFICVNHCKRCYLRKDISAPFEEIESPILLGDLKVYSVNYQNDLYRPDLGRYQDNKICLRVDFYRNGSSTPLILENEEGVFFLPAFFGSPQKTDSTEEAKALWLAHTEDLKEQGEYY